MNYYMAPMESLTTYIYRKNYARYFGGIDKYFTPFIANKKMNRREMDEILPEHNEGMTLIPQILTNLVDEFLSISSQLAEFGYDTVNLNLGCPSGTVTAKKRGAGFLSVPDELDLFLSQIFEKCPLKISVKTRIGVSSVNEWERLLSIYEKYPMDELIIHPRLQKEMYTGTPHVDAYQLAVGSLPMPLCYNGDIVSEASLHDAVNKAPSITNVMIGRGLLMNPYLIYELKSSSSGTAPRTPVIDKQHLRAFHDDIYRDYQERMSGEQPVLFKMKELWFFMQNCFEQPEKALKKIRKANHFRDYEFAVDSMFLLNPVK